MASRVIRVDDEVYAHLLAARANLEASTGRVVTIGAALGFLLALSRLGAVAA